MVSNDNEALLCAARQGLGIFAAGEWLMSRDLEAGRLVRVLPEWQLDADAGVYLVRPSARYATAAASAPMGGSAVRRWPALAAPAGLSGIRERLAEERAASRPSLPDNPDTLPPACG